MKIGNKEKTKEMSEEEALKMLNELWEKAMKLDKGYPEKVGVYSSKFRSILEDIPRILEDFKRIERARGITYSKEFDEKELTPFLNEFAFSLSKLTKKCKQAIGPYEYLNIRGDVADFLAQEGPCGESMETHHQLDFLFESNYISKLTLGHPDDYKSTIIALIAGLKMLNSIMPALIQNNANPKK